MKTLMYSKSVKVHKNVPQNYFGEISISLLDISTQSKLSQIFSNRLRLEVIIYAHAFKFKSFYAIINLPQLVYLNKKLLRMGNLRKTSFY